MQTEYQASLSKIKLLSGKLSFSKVKPEEQHWANDPIINNLNFYELEQKGMGIIFIKQNYKHLFYDPSKKLQLPVRGMHFKFYDSKKDRWLLKISLGVDSVVLQTAQEGDLKGLQVVKQLNRALFPTQKDAPMMLQKKIWIQLNKLINIVNISTGDIVGLQEEVLLYHEFQEITEKKDSWKTQAVKFLMPSYNNIKEARPLKVSGILQRLKYFTVEINVCENGECTTKQRIDDFLVIKLFNAGKIFDPVLQKNPSLLKPEVANLQAVAKPLKILYNYLEKLNLTELPDYEQKPTELLQKKGYTEWKDFKFAAQHSLTTPFGYTLDGKPIGILNHMYRMKTQKDYKQLILNPRRVESQEEKNILRDKESILKHIFTKRCGYLRLELLPHEGLGPGSIAVLQIWPPYHSSSIHNHGEAYGLIKVLSGSIRVQNFSELSFESLQKEPYQRNDYVQDQFTWLSQQSFGIHRLVNVHPQICITLQAYYHNQNTTEYFSVIKQTDKQKLYIEYYPQNDWKNYLNLAYEIIGQKDFYKQEDIQFIKNVIKTYKLQESNKINSEFYKLALILKDEYEYVKNFSLAVPKNQDMPNQLSSKVIYWIDGNHKRNQQIAESFKSRGIEVIKMANTKSLVELFSRSLQQLKNMNKSVIVISNMNRTEGDRVNDQAGVEVFQLVNNVKLKWKCIVFVGDALQARYKLKKAKLQHVQVIQYKIELSKRVFREFGL